MNKPFPYNHFHFSNITGSLKFKFTEMFQTMHLHSSTWLKLTVKQKLKDLF